MLNNMFLNIFLFQGLLLFQIYRMIKYKKLFPSKKRWLKFLLPGFILGASGLIIFATIETEENYMYTHSFWHIVITLSIMFLLPPRRKEKKGIEVPTLASFTYEQFARDRLNALNPDVSSLNEPISEDSSRSRNSDASFRHKPFSEEKSPSEKRDSSFVNRQFLGDDSDSRNLHGSISSGQFTGISSVSEN